MKFRKPRITTAIAFAFGRAQRLLETLPPEVCPSCKGSDPNVLTLGFVRSPGAFGRARSKLLGRLAVDVKVVRCSMCPKEEQT